MRKKGKKKKISSLELDEMADDEIRRLARVQNLEDTLEPLVSLFQFATLASSQGQGLQATKPFGIHMESQSLGQNYDANFMHSLINILNRSRE